MPERYQGDSFDDISTGYPGYQRDVNEPRTSQGYQQKNRCTRIYFMSIF